LLPWHAIYLHIVEARFVLISA
jgi:hypothetical protein